MGGRINTFFCVFEEGMVLGELGGELCQKATPIKVHGMRESCVYLQLQITKRRACNNADHADMAAFESAPQ